MIPVVSEQVPFYIVFQPLTVLFLVRKSVMIRVSRVLLFDNIL